MKRPDARGYFGDFGGRFVPEVLIAALDRLERAMNEAFADPSYWDEYNAVLRDFVGRPSPLYRCERYIAGLSAVPLLMKREDTNHTGAHKINNTVGQALLALRMGKRQLLAETGAGQHGVATATVGAKFGLTVDVYMGARDVERQALNVHVMRLLGAKVHSVDERNANAQRCDERSLSRLGRARRGCVLRDRQRGRRASLSISRARAAKDRGH